MVQAKTVHRSLALVCAAAAVILAASSCSNPVLAALNTMSSRSFGLAGAWKNTNTSYIALATPPQCYLLTINSDGTFRSSDSGGSMGVTGTYTIESETVSGDTRTFTIHFQFTAMHVYALVRASPGIYETNGVTFLPYPTTIDPSNFATYSKFIPQ